MDGGGGNGLLRQLKRAGIEPRDIQDIFVTHRHTDHITGIFWMLREFARPDPPGKPKREVNINIYSHAEVIHILRTMADLLFPDRDGDGIRESVHFIRKNPFAFELASVVVNDSVTREAITRKQQREFLRFIQEDKHFCRYYDGIYILFSTGLRISEFCGLTIRDIDYKEMRIRVDHQLQRKRDMTYIIEETKTKSGTRFVPMTMEVAASFRRIISARQTPKKEPMIDGVTGFLFLDKNGMPMVALHWEKYFRSIRDKYNSIYKVQMPKITPHVCRHTFCSNMAKSGINPKTLQYIMGHADISVTLNTYTHVDFEDAQAEFIRVAGA